MQTIVVFQEKGSGASKIAGIGRYGSGRIRVVSVDIGADLPPIIDESAPYLPETVQGDLVLDYLRHPDLSADLAIRCAVLGIPVVAPGKRWPEAITPPT